MSTKTPGFEYKHGNNGYRYGCRCKVCKEGHAATANRLKHNYGPIELAKIQERNRNYCRINPERRREKVWRAQGIDMTCWSWSQYLKLLEDQDGLCAVCGIGLVATQGVGIPKGNFITAHVDHNHVTGRVRGLLCRACNQAAGCLCDDPVRVDKLAAYLRLHN